MPRRRRHYDLYIRDSDDEQNPYGSSSTYAAFSRQNAENAKLEEALEDLNENEETVEVWKHYECKSLEFGIQHPGDIVEAASLSAVSLPAHSYPLQGSLARQIEEGTLSSMQLEGIMYACERHSRYLPDGRRAGFFVGDSAGVGKGRQMAGIILDNLLRGRKRHVWFSASKDLHLDATRDLRDIGCTVQVFDSISSLGRRLKTHTVTEAVVFCTYNELTSAGSRDTGLTRFEELIRWLCAGSTSLERRAFDGVIVFDECHKAKNYFEGRAEKSSTKAGINVVQLQEELPNARVVYSSATGISAVENMGYMSRMGLWGEKTSFQNFAEFSTAIGGGKSVAALEMLALEFKATGCQVARNVGYHGAEFSTVSANLSPDDARMYRAAAELWRDVFEGMQKCHDLCKKTPHDEYRPSRADLPKGYEGNSVKMFWSFHQRFMRQLIASLKIPALAHVANESLKAGYCVVIGLQTTGEAALGRALQDELEEYGLQNANVVVDDEEDEEAKADGQGAKRVGRRAGKRGQILNSQNGDLVSVCRSILKSFLVNWFPTKQVWVPLPTDPKEIPYLPDRSDLFIELWLICRDVPNLDSKMFIPKVMQYLVSPNLENLNWVGTVPSYDRDGTIVECKRMQARLLARLNNIYLPPCALDDLIDRLGGPGEVAEMTGRTLRQVRLEDGTVAVHSRVRAPQKADRRAKNDLTSWGDTAKASLNVQERGAFMRGEKLVAIISEAASTGISLHADRTAINQRRRVHCTLELPWAADQAIQQLGRSHRTNQSSAPIFRLLSSGLGGEHRFISSVSRRLQSLGALTQGDRRASVGAMTFGEFQFESDHGRNALMALYDSIIKRHLPPNVNWRDIVQQSMEHLKLDFGFNPEEEVPETVEPAAIKTERKGPGKKEKEAHVPWCPAANPRMKSEAEFFDALQEAAKFTGGLKHTTEPEDPFAPGGRRNRRRAVMATTTAAPVFYGGAPLVSASAPAQKRLIPIDPKAFNQNVVKDVPRFFNRILGLPFSQQSLLFNYFNALLEEDIKEAKRNGKYDRGVQILDGQNISRVRSPELIYRDPGTGGKLMIHALIRDRGVHFKDIIRELRYRNAALYNPSVKREDFPLVDPPTPTSLATALNEAGDNGHFFRSNKEIFGRMRTCLAIRLGTSQWKIIRPGTGIFSASQMADDTLRRNYHVVTNFEKLRRFWQEEFDWTEKECTHGRGCKAGSLCTVGRRKFETNILTGNVISLWSQLDRLIQDITSLPKSERTMSIVQTNITDTRERVVGVIWPVAAVPRLRQMVQELKDKHDQERRAVVIRGLPLKNVLPRPSTSMIVDYASRERFYQLDLQYQTWLGTSLTTDDQLKMLGFAIDDKGIVTTVDSRAQAMGVHFGYRLFRVGYFPFSDPVRIKLDLRRTVMEVSRAQADKSLSVPEITFLRPRTAKDDEDDERLWREGLSREPATPVDPVAVTRLVTDPKLLRPRQEEQVEATEEDVATATKKKSSSKKRKISPESDDDEDLDPPSDEAGGRSSTDNVSSRSPPYSTSGRASRSRTPVDYAKLGGIDDEDYDDQPNDEDLKDAPMSEKEEDEEDE